MKKIKDSVASLILFISVGTLLLIVLYSYNQTSKAIYKLNNSISNLEYSLNSFSKTGDIDNESEIIEIDETWNKYINYDLGFEINYPKSTDFGLVEIRESGNVVYLISSDLQRKEIAKKEGMNDFEKVKGIPYAILIKDAKGIDELEKFIKNRYGEDCSLGEISLNKENGLYSVRVSSSDEINSVEPRSCFMNFGYKIVYDRENGKVAAWDMGQSAKFMEGENFYDNEINKSFKFID